MSIQNFLSPPKAAEHFSSNCIKLPFALAANADKQYFLKKPMLFIFAKQNEQHRLFQKFYSAAAGGRIPASPPVSKFACFYPYHPPQHTAGVSTKIFVKRFALRKTSYIFATN
jgi:hypothetical protein